MNERELLLRAVCEHPDDDTPRLVFADWLQEHGDEARAEFIRLQIRLAAISEAERKPEDVARETELLNKNKAEWTEPLREFESSSGGHYEFRQGFVERMKANAAAVTERGHLLFKQMPARSLVFDDEPDYNSLSRCAWLLRLRSLRLEASAHGEIFAPAPLLRSRNLANLTALAVRGNVGYEPFLNRAAIRALVASKHLSRLEELDLGGNCFNEFSGNVFEHFLSRAAFPSLRKLDLGCTILHDEQAELLAGTAWIAQLRELILNWNEIGEGGLRAILESPHLQNIQWLDLSAGMERVEYFEPAHPYNDVKRRLRERFGARVVL